MADLPHGKEGTDDLWDAMYTQRAIRYWQEKPVPRELLEKVIESASKAPSGSNLQPWVFIVIDDAGTRGPMVNHRNQKALAHHPGNHRAG